MEKTLTLDNTGLLEHYKSDGVYLRVMNASKGTFIIGHKHRTAHLSVLLKGAIRISIGSETREFKAPHIFESLPNSRKIGIVLEDCKIANIFPTLPDENVLGTLNRCVDYDTSDVESTNILDYKGLLCQ